MNSKTKGSSKERNSEELVIYLNKEKKPGLPGPTLPTASYYNCSQVLSLTEKDFLFRHVSAAPPPFLLPWMWRWESSHLDHKGTCVWMKRPPSERHSKVTGVDLLGQPQNRLSTHMMTANVATNHPSDTETGQLSIISKSFFLFIWL